MKIIKKGSAGDTFESKLKSIDRNKIYLYSSIVLIVIVVIILLRIIISQSSDGDKSSKTTQTSKVETTQKELELKEKELKLKEEELNRQKQSNRQSNVPGNYPEASTRYLSSSELAGVSKYSLRIMRNEIFARHGYIFKTDEMRNHFFNQSWYIPLYDNVDGLLTPIEKANINLIKSFE